MKIGHKGIDNLEIDPRIQEDPGPTMPSGLRQIIPGATEGTNPRLQCAYRRGPDGDHPMPIPPRVADGNGSGVGHDRVLRMHFMVGNTVGPYRTERIGTALLVLAGPGSAHGRTSSRTGDLTARTGVLGPAASYRLVLEDHHWEWRDGEIGGLTLRVQTLRARGAPSATNAPDLARPSGGDARVDQGRGGGVGAEDPLAIHTLAFRLHRPARDGALPGGGGIASGAWILQSAMPATDLPGRVRATPPVTGTPRRVAVG